MKSDNRLINKAFIGIWAVNGVSMLFSIACVMIDAIITGQFLGKEAVTAAGLVQPVIMLLNIVGGLLGPGLGIVCTRYMGMARKDLVNKVFGMIMELTFILSIIISVLIFILAPNIANVLGTKTNNPLIISMVSDYLKGFSLAVLPMWFSISLSGLMMVDNDRVRGLAGMIIVLFSDALLDYLNAIVFHGGMLGMALATAASNFLGFIVILTHFTKKDRVLRFSFVKFDMKQIKEVISCSVPNAISLGSMALRGFAFNAFLLTTSGAVTVAAIASANSLFSIINAVCLGIFTTASALSSMLFGEEDRNGIIKAFKVSVKVMLLLMTSLSILLMLFAGVFARGFLDASATKELAEAAVFIRFMTIQYMFFTLSFSLGGAYQGTRKNMYSNILAFIREAAFPIACCLIMGSAFGLDGFRIGLILSGVLSFLSCYIIPAVVKKKLSVDSADLIMLSDGFGAGPEDTFEASMSSMEEVMVASERAREFCIKKNMDKRTAHMTALFIEETVGNAMAHKSGKEVIAEVRVILKDEARIIRIRDNGKQFDPVEWYEKNHPEDPSSGLGIRIVMSLAKEVRFVPALGLNNLMIRM